MESLQVVLQSFTAADDCLFSGSRALALLRGASFSSYVLVVLVVALESQVPEARGETPVVPIPAPMRRHTLRPESV